MSQEEISPEEVAALRRRIEDIEDRVEELESGSSSSVGSSGGPGHRDQAVIDQLESGDIVTVSGLKKLYRTNTDIRSERTLKNRVKSLTNRPEFDWTAPGKWRYNEGDSDE